MNATNREKQFCSRRVHASFVAAFTLTELLVVIAILALLAATQLPALTGGKAPVGFTQCLNNLRQIGQATMVYKSDNNDAFPFGNRIAGAGTGAGSVIDPTGWPMQLLPHLGGYRTNVQPMVYVCPNENRMAIGWAFQMHYVANRYFLSDVDDLPGPILGSQVRKPSLYWMFMEKGPSDYCSMRSGSLANPILIAWNVPPGYSQFRRHNGGFAATAADGRVDWLRPPPYRPGAPPPQNFGELGDTSDGLNPGSSWVDSGLPKKLFCRKRQAVPPGIAF